MTGYVAEIWRYPVKSMAGELIERAAVGARGIAGDRGWALRDDRAMEIRGAKKWPVLLRCAARYRHEPDGEAVAHADITLPDGTVTATDDPDVNRLLSALVNTAVSLWPLQPADNEAHYRRANPAAPVARMLARTAIGARVVQTMLSGALRKEFSRTSGEPIPDMSALPSELYEFTCPPGTYFDVAALHLLTTASLATLARYAPDANWDRRRFRPNVLLSIDDGRDGLVETDWAGRNVKIGAVTCRCDIPTPRCGMPTYAQQALEADPHVLRTIVREADQNLGVYASVAAAGRFDVGDRFELPDESR